MDDYCTNYCDFKAKFVAKTELDLLDIKDVLYSASSNYYLYGLIDRSIELSIKEEGDYYTMIVDGDCICSVASSLMEYDIEPDHETGAECISLDDLCKKYKTAVELFSKEPGMCFQEYLMIDSDGTILDDRRIEWYMGVDEETYESNPSKDIGGFPDWGEFMSAEEIYDNKENIGRWNAEDYYP